MIQIKYRFSYTYMYTFFFFIVHLHVNAINASRCGLEDLISWGLCLFFALLVFTYLVTVYFDCPL